MGHNSKTKNSRTHAYILTPFSLVLCIENASKSLLYFSETPCISEILCIDLQSYWYSFLVRNLKEQATLGIIINLGYFGN